MKNNIGISVEDNTSQHESRQSSEVEEMREEFFRKIQTAPSQF